MKNELSLPQLDLDIENLRVTFIPHSTDNEAVFSEIAALHSHPFNLLYIADGKSIKIITDEKTFSLSHDDALFLPANTPHRIVPESDDVCFSSGFTLSDNGFEFNEDVFTHFSKLFNSLYPIQMSNRTDLSGIINELRITYEKKDFAVLYRIKICLTHLIFALYDSLSFLSGDHPIEQMSPETMDKYKTANLRPLIINTYMSEHFRENITLEQLSSIMFLSPKQLSRIIKATYGQTFYTRLTDMRIKEAKRLLLNKTLTIEEVAFLVGFSTHTGFYKAFLQTTGKKPSEWRRENEKNNIQKSEDE